jgi:opacity protein-like surface antigen
MHLHGFNVSPVLRYTRWSSSNSAAFYLRPILDQVEFVVGFDQSSESAWPTAFGHRPALGLVVGGSATDDFEDSNRGSYVVGAMAEFKLPRDLSVEIDGLYRKLRFSYRREVVLTWEFPLLAKYKFPTRRVKPLIELGPSFRATGNLNDADPSHFGFTAGAGIETTLRRLKIAPVVRFTRWAADNRNLGSITKPNQVELLVGFSF